MGRPEITAVNHYNVFPFNHGGSLGIRGLYKALSEWFDINIITFVVEDVYPDELEISKHVKVIPIVLPEELIHIQYAMYEEYGMGKDTLIDSSPTVVLWYHKFPEIIERVREISKNSIVVFAEHVFTWRIVKEACPHKHLWYRANNVEYDYKRTTWDKIGCPSNLLQDTYEIEKECCEECERILAVSKLEIDRFMELYNLPERFRKKFVDIRSGYDTDNLKTVMPSQRKKVSQKYSNVGFFITSYTPYGQRAAENCIAIAKECPDLQIIIAGTIKRGFIERPLPENILFTGVISDEEKVYYLQHCDFALNLLEEGAGINVKMFEYFAFGIPVITTEYGARGIAVNGGQNCILAKRGHYVEDIRAFCSMSLSEKDDISQKALRLLLDQYSWRSLGRKVAIEIGELYDLPILDYALPLDEIMLYEFSETESYFPKGPFYIRCAGEYGQKCLKFVRMMGLEPIAFVDEDNKKIGKVENGVPIISVKQFLDEKKGEDIIVAVSFPQIISITSELLAFNILSENISLSWDITGRRIMRLSDLEGCVPHYFDARKWRKEIMKQAF